MRFPSFALALINVVGMGCLVGCGGMGTFPNTDPGTTPIGEIHGVNMGGHAPLGGAHIYLLEAGNTGYGSVAKSLINSSASGATKNGSWENSGYGSDLFVPSVDAVGQPFYGLTANPGGQFVLTGDYSCDVGRVVYVVGVGGNPGLSGSPVTVSSAQVQSTSGSGASEQALVLFNFTSSPNFSNGTNLTFSGFNGSFQTGTGINGTTSVVISSAGPAVSVYIPDPNGAIAVGTYTVSGTATPSFFNHASVNVAVLGKCPSTGTFAGVIPYVIMNEVSTVASAYVFQPYVATSGTNQSGIDEFHIGSSSTALGLQGIQLAAANAANLYDITGSNGAINNPIALAVLPSNSNGTVPQAELDTLGNILASCVDSGNSYRNGVGTLQASCQSLFQYASSNGVYDTSAGNSWTLSTSTDAFNTFQAAVNIARFPQGAGVGSTTSGTQTVTTAFSSTTAASYTGALYALETGTVPFTPNLHSTSAGAPNSFAVGIIIALADPGMGYTGILAVVIDGYGNAWVESSVSSGSEISKFSSTGAPLLSFYLASPNNSGPFDNEIAIDRSNNIWVGAWNSPTPSAILEYSNNGAALMTVTGNGIADPSGIAFDGAGNIWVTNFAPVSGSGPAYYSKFSASGAALFNVTPPINGVTDTYGLAIDGSGNVFAIATDSVQGQTYPGTIAKFSSSGAYLSTFSGTDIFNPTAIVIDSFGNTWSTDQGFPDVAHFSNNGTELPDLTANGMSAATAPGIAVDGVGNIWTTNNAPSIVGDQFVYAASVFAFTNSSQPLSNLSGLGLGKAGPMSIDGSGNAWIANRASYQGGPASSLTEIIGVAAPVITPLCAGLPATPTANGSSNLGTRP